MKGLKRQVTTIIYTIQFSAAPLIFAMTAKSSSPQAQASARLVYGKDDSLFGCIENLQGDIPFGSVLDAGTGMHSLRWLATLSSRGLTDFCAMTADATMQRQVQMEAEVLGVSEMGQVMIGNWFPNDPKEQVTLEQQFDVILADYLIGAMDGFSPYRQNEMIPLLCQYLKPGGRLYIVGLEPIPDSVSGPANVICKVRQARDACILLANHRCYREYPLEWIKQQVNDCKSLQLVNSFQFPILYRYETILKQVNVGRSKLKLFGNSHLADGMAQALNELDAQALEATQQSGRLQLGFDYVVAAEKR
ncbi:hypothetical protein MPSEU_001001900 [Mayamaea pseudoterrestris]|nr:hypothetical protein MPSEU_001001900 [Mayamaea pseudoterrestris]